MYYDVYYNFKNFGEFYLFLTYIDHIQSHYLNKAAQIWGSLKELRKCENSYFNNDYQLTSFNKVWIEPEKYINKATLSNLITLENLCDESIFKIYPRNIASDYVETKFMNLAKRSDIRYLCKRSFKSNFS